MGVEDESKSGSLPTANGPASQDVRSEMVQEGPEMGGVPNGGTATPSTVEDAGNDDPSRNTTVPNASQERLKAFVMGVCDGRVFTDLHCRSPEDVGMVFMPIALGAFAESSTEFINSIGCIYEFLDKAGPISVNGMPSFFSLQILNKEDAVAAWTAVEEELKRRESVSV